MKETMKTKDRCDTRIIHMEKIRAAKNSSLPDGELDALSQFFKTFADPSRVKILMALGQQEMCVCDLAAFLDISQSAVSHQLRYLRSCRLVRNRRDGTVLYYRLVDKHVVEIIGKGLEHIREL